jgi:hypothetical protein
MRDNLVHNTHARHKSERNEYRGKDEEYDSDDQRGNPAVVHYVVTRAGQNELVPTRTSWYRPMFQDNSKCDGDQGTVS